MLYINNYRCCIYFIHFFAKIAQMDQLQLHRLRKPAQQSTSSCSSKSLTFYSGILLLILITKFQLIIHDHLFHKSHFISHNKPFRTEMCTFLFWMMYRDMALLNCEIVIFASDAQNLDSHFCRWWVVAWQTHSSQHPERLVQNVCTLQNELSLCPCQTQTCPLTFLQGLQGHHHRMCLNLAMKLISAQPDWTHCSAL